MDRRRFLNLAAGTTAAGAATVFWPDWLARAFAAPNGEEGNAAADTFGDVGAAYRRAKALGKPLLVFVVPAKTGDRFGQGQIFGALLNFGSKEALADLALCEVVCAKTETVRDTLEIKKDLGKPLMILVETSTRSGVTVIAPELPKISFGRGGGGESGEAKERERLKLVERAIRQAVVPNAKVLDARARDARIALGEEKSAVLIKTLGDGTPDEDALRRGAAIVRFKAESDPDHRGAWVAALAATTEKQLKKGIPEGARWANFCGCGVEVEGEKDSLGVACGMGYVPELSQRFLYFYTR